MNLTYLVSLLPLLACPLGMSLMMWLMMRGHKDQAGDAPARPLETTVPSPTIAPTATTTNSPDQLTALHAQLRQVEMEQAALAAQLAPLGAAERPAERQASAPAPVSPPAR